MYFFPIFFLALYCVFKNTSVHNGLDPRAEEHAPGWWISRASFQLQE